MRTGSRLAVAVVVLALTACSASTGDDAPTATPTASHAHPSQPPKASARPAPQMRHALPGMPPIPDPNNIYADAGAAHLSPRVRHDKPLIYVPNLSSNTVSVINPRTYKVIDTFPVGLGPQHVVPSYDLRTLWVNDDIGNELTPINPRTGRPGRSIHVADPYNLYFTPDGNYAMVMAERNRDIDFRDPQTMRLEHRLRVPGCAGVNHVDFSANGRYFIATCEFNGRLIKVDTVHQRVVATISLSLGSQPQDIKLSPDGKVFYVADLRLGGVWVVRGTPLRRVGFIPTGKGAHGLYPSRDGRFLYISNRDEGSVSVLRFSTRTVVRKWWIPGGGSPDMGNVSADGSVLWLSGRYNDVVYAINTRTGHLIAKIPVGNEPHGLCVWPQPGRYSLGHTGIMR